MDCAGYCQQSFSPSPQMFTDNDWVNKFSIKDPQKVSNQTGTAVIGGNNLAKPVDYFSSSNLWYPKLLIRYLSSVFLAFYWTNCFLFFCFSLQPRIFLCDSLLYSLCRYLSLVHVFPFPSHPKQIRAANSISVVNLISMT